MDRLARITLLAMASAAAAFDDFDDENDFFGLVVGFALCVPTSYFRRANLCLHIYLRTTGLQTAQTAHLHLYRVVGRWARSRQVLLCPLDGFHLSTQLLSAAYNPIEAEIATKNDLDA